MKLDHRTRQCRDRRIEPDAATLTIGTIWAICIPIDLLPRPRVFCPIRSHKATRVGRGDGIPMRQRLVNEVRPESQNVRGFELPRMTRKSAVNVSVERDQRIPGDRPV